MYIHYTAGELLSIPRVDFSVLILHFKSIKLKAVLNYVTTDRENIQRSEETDLIWECTAWLINSKAENTPAAVQWPTVALTSQSETIRPSNS